MSAGRYLSTLLIFCGLSFGAANEGALGPFLGKWEVDKEKTSAASAPGKLKCEIEKNGGKGVVIKSQYVEPKNSVYPLLWVGIMTYELPLNVDGTPTTNHIGPFTHVSKTTVADNKMITDFTATLENGNVTGKWVRTVSSDGREMTLQIQSKASDGRRLDQTLVFKRK